MRGKMTEDKETIEIYVERYNALLKAEAFLDALIAAGVDNWEGSDYAREIMEEQKDVSQAF
jgi:hypothetical protein